MGYRRWTASSWGRTRRGFTLIELIIVTAAMVFLMGSLLALNFRASGAWVTEQERARRMQNFRFAGEKIVSEVRAASKKGTTEWNGAKLVMTPSQNQLTNRLRFRVYTPAEGSNPESAVQIEYYLTGDEQTGFQIMRKEYYDTVANVDGSVPATVKSTQPVSEKLTTLAAVYFVRQGNRVVIIMVAKYNVGGQEQVASYTRQVFLRGATTND